MVFYTLKIFEDPQNQFQTFKCTGLSSISTTYVYSNQNIGEGRSAAYSNGHGLRCNFL